ncbi:MAG: PAS domain S-box protein [SAR324 cluster bacterium]|nr:PAS domain S-box protein [SAR324 cluster bacterium]
MSDNKTSIDSRYEGQLSRTLLFWVVAISSFFAILTTGFQLYFSFAEDRANIFNNLEFIKESYVQSIATSAFNLDENQARIILHGIQAIPDIVFLEVWDRQSKWISMQLSDGKKDIVMEFPLIYTDTSGKTQSFGKLVVAASLEDVYQRLWKDTFLILGSNILKTLAASLFIFLLFQWSITRHLLRIASYFRKLDFNNLEQELVLDRQKSKPDELDGLTMAINDMRTRLIQTSEERQQADKRFRSFSEQSLMGICVIQHDCVAYANQAIADIFGYTIQEMMNWPAKALYTKIIYLEDLPKVQEQARKKQAGDTEGTIPRYEWRAVNASGEWFWVESYSLTITYQNEGADLVYLIDITERKQTEEEIKTLNQELEQRVVKRTEELQESLNSLRKTQKQLVVQEKLASLGSMTAGISHELKNPLHLVNNFAEQCSLLSEDLQKELNKGEGDRNQETISQLLTMIAKAANTTYKHSQRADNVIRAMLLHSRGTGGEWQLMDLNLLLKEYTTLAFHSMRAINYTFNANLESNFDSSIGQIKMVPQDLSRAFLNILNNALYAVCEKSQQSLEHYVPTIKTTTKNLGNWIEIRIWDNGTGIPEKNKNKIMEPFFTTKPAGSGTGLGLSLSYEIVVQEHEGTFQIESSEGEYTEFILTIPNKQ